MADDAVDLNRVSSQAASSPVIPRLAPIFAASSTVSKRAREIPAQIEDMPGSSSEISAITSSVQSEDRGVKKVKTVLAESTIIGAPATSASSSVASTTTDTVVNGSVPESKMTFKWLPSNPSRLLHGIYGTPHFSNKLACFDIDGTLIAPASGAKFPKSAQDWVFWCGKGNVQSRLKEYHQRGYSIVFISNQNYPPHHKSHQNFKMKMPLVGKALGIPFRVLAATAKDEYRKPDIGMWRTLQQTYTAQGFTPDKSQSFYVGDAAGRPARRVKAPLANGKFQTRSFAKDHHDTDKGWAQNVGITFYTPEEFFWDRKDEQLKVTDSTMSEPVQTASP